VVAGWGTVFTAGDFNGTADIREVIVQLETS
jgi:hypothetical protein